MDAKTLGAQPAHPMPVGINCNSGGTYAASPIDGLTKREAFAMAAMQGILGNAYWNEFGGFSPDEVASASREYADALLAALSQEPQ